MRNRSPFVSGSGSVEHVSEIPRAAATGVPACTACATTAATSSSAFSSARLPAERLAVALRRLLGGNVDGEPLRVHGLARLVAYDGVAVLQPHDMPVRSDEPVLELERLRVAPCLPLCLAHAVAILGVQVVD